MAHTEPFVLNNLPLQASLPYSLTSAHISTHITTSAAAKHHQQTILPPLLHPTSSPDHAVLPQQLHNHDGETRQEPQHIGELI